MIKNFLKVTFRSLAKNKTFVIINTVGLGITLACCIVAYLNYTFNSEFDSNHLNSERIYRVNFIRTTNGYPIRNGSSPMPIGNVVRESFSQVDEVIRYHPTGGNFKVGDDLFRIGVGLVDDAWFDTFTFPMLYGDGSLISDKSTIFLNEETAEKFFRGENPVGEIITYINNDKRIDFKVGGVFKKPPVNSSFQNDAFANYSNLREIDEVDPNQDWASFTTTFVTVNNPGDVPTINNNLQDYVEIQNQAKPDYKVKEYYLDSFVGMAARAQEDDMWNHWMWSAMPPPAVVAPGIMAILILLIACFNFTNTSIAIANRRLKEIGLRKVLGSSRQMMVAQFLGENIILALFGLLVGVLIAYFLVPAYSNMWAFLEIKMDFANDLGFYGFLTILLLFTGLIAGSYPAFYVTKFQPSAILRGTLKYGGTGKMTKVLLTLQYSISTVAIISGVLFAKNARYQEEFDLGFERKGVVYSFVGTEDRYNQIYNLINSNIQINEIAGSSHSVIGSWYTDPIKYEETELDVDLLDVGDNYLNALGIKVKEGRNFIKDSESDQLQSVIVNDDLVKTLGWEEAVGKRIVLRDTLQLYVVGVVKDLYLRSLWEPVKPMLIRYVKPDKYRFISIKTDPENTKEVFDFVESKWKVAFPDELSTVSFMDNSNGEEASTVNANIRIIFSFLSLVAVLLSAAGLYSLVILNIIKRMKEIGVRKVLGARIGNIAYVVNKAFLILIFIAVVIGSGIGYWLTDMLMGSIWTYHLGFSIDAFIFAAVIILGISILTVGNKVYSAAKANPAQTLKDE